MLDTYFADKKFLALMLLIKEEINKLRKQVGLSEYSDEQIKKAFKNKLNELGHICEISGEQDAKNI